jgi:glycosyltransferase involved in cell wall biosynthesis
VIEAMKAMANVRDAFLVIAGDGPQREEVDRLAADLLPGRFLRATFSRDQMPVLYRSADVFLHTKIEESFGNVYIEALSAGVPVVAHDDAVTRWIFDGRATLIDTRSSANLTGAIERALTAPGRDAAEDADWAQRRFAWSKVASQYEQFFETVLEQYSSQ